MPRTLSRAVVRSSGRNASNTALTAGMIRIALTDRTEPGVGHGRSPRKRSSACMSTESKRSVIRNRKIPITINAMRIENATLISTTSGMPFAPVAARMSPFSIDMKPITWPTALRRDTIISKPRRMTDKCKGKILAHERALGSGDRQHDQDRQRHQADAAQHGLPDADHGLDVAMDAQPHDDAVKHHWDHDRLDDQRDRGGDVQMRRVLDVRLPRHRHRDHEGVQGERIEQAEHAILVEQHEADEHQAAGEQMRDIQSEAIHHTPRETKRSNGASRASMSAAPRKSGNAEDAHLGDRRLERRPAGIRRPPA